MASFSKEPCDDVETASGEALGDDVDITGGEALAFLGSNGKHLHASEYIESSFQEACNVASVRVLCRYGERERLECSTM